MIGKATDVKRWLETIAIADSTEPLIDSREERQSMLIPATWIIPLKGNRPADVNTE
jgi:hypothetical protein